MHVNIFICIVHHTGYRRHCTFKSQNLHKAQRWWGVISRVIEMTEETVRARGAMYKAVAQSVLIYESES